MGAGDGPLVSVADYARAAREALPGDVYDYYAGGALDELTLGDNEAAWRRLRLWYRVLSGVAGPDLRTAVLGQEVALPVLVAPTAFHRLACQEGEPAAARAAGRAGTIFVLSSLSNTPMEEVFPAGEGPKWFQLYVYKDRGVTQALVERAEAAGARAIVLTVDAPGWGQRERDARNGFTLPAGLGVANLGPAGLANFPAVSGSGLAAYCREHFEPALRAEHVAWLCGITRLPVVVKGVCRGDDAGRAVDSGASAVVVSNHGGRQVDTAPATCDALPHVVAAVGERAEVYVDGGIRRGSDVLKACALGARAVLVGRPVLWGLATAGEEGAAGVLGLLAEELATAMLLCGCASVADIQPGLLSPGE